MAVGFAAVAVIVAACSSTGTIPSSTQAFRNSIEDGTPPPAYTFKYTTVDAPRGEGNTRVTGIDERPDMILGITGSTHNTYDSLVAHTPNPSETGYHEFRPRSYPGAAGTYMSAMSSAFYQGGTVFSPKPNSHLQCTTCGVTYYGKGSGTGYGDGNGCNGGPCQWTFVQDPSEGTGRCAVTEVLGMAYSDIVVGFYKTGAHDCGSQAFEAYSSPSGQQFADFDVPNADPYTAKATALNEKGEVVGTALFDGVTKGWYYVDASYCTRLSAPKSTATYFLGINWEDQIVGYYVDQKQATHGFILFNPASSQRVWETIDAPGADNYTVVSDINTHHYITGWYRAVRGRMHGFVGACTSCNKQKGGSGSAEPIGDSVSAPDSEKARCTEKGMGRQRL